jgi:hypothetical protein
MKLVSFVIATWPLLIIGGAAAADLHPIVEVQSGHLFGATSNGKWMKPEEAAKALPGEMTYQIYGLTQSLGQAKGGKPKLARQDEHPVTGKGLVAARNIFG